MNKAYIYYKRVLKENEILKEEKEQAWEEWNNLEQGSYETEQKLKQQIKKLQKENEELKADLYNANLIINEYVDTYKDCISKEIELSSEDVKAMLEKPEKYFKIRTACYKE